MYVVSSVTGNRVSTAAAIKSADAVPTSAINTPENHPKSDIPLAVTLKNQMLRFLRRTKSQRGSSVGRLVASPPPLTPGPFVIPNNRVASVVEPYAIGVVPTNNTTNTTPTYKPRPQSTIHHVHQAREHQMPASKAARDTRRHSSHGPGHHHHHQLRRASKVTITN